MSKKSKVTKQEPVQTIYKIGGQHDLVFMTTKDVTVCFCEFIKYDKLVARHTGCKDLKIMHENLKHLFQQYIEDAERCLNLTHRSTE